MIFEITNINLISESFTSQTDFWLTLHVDIGELGGRGNETITVHVVGIERLAALSLNEPVIGRGKIIVSEYKAKEVEEAILKIIRGFDPKNWDDLYATLGKYFDFI